MKKKIAFVAILAILLVAFGACAALPGQVKTLYEGDGLKVEQEGATMRVYDLVGHASYSFTAHRTRAKTGSPEAPKTARTAINTPTIMIQTVYDLVIVTMKGGGDPLYFRVRG